MSTSTPPAPSPPSTRRASSPMACTVKVQIPVPADRFQAPHGKYELKHTADPSRQNRQ